MVARPAGVLGIVWRRLEDQPRAAACARPDDDARSFQVLFEPRSSPIKIFGIRQAKSHLSELVRNAAKGECSLVTDNRKPVAMIGPPPNDVHDRQALLNDEDDGAETRSPPVSKELSDAAGFRKALFGAPHPLELDF
jgi:antitoxin (DNA-binding transcriptional repressor) of toxin-antitoxin stability system